MLQSRGHRDLDVTVVQQLNNKSPNHKWSATLRGDISSVIISVQHFLENYLPHSNCVTCHVSLLN